MAPAAGEQQIEGVNVGQLAVRDVDEKLGMLSRRSSRVCLFTAALVARKSAHGNSDSHRSMVVESIASTVLVNSKPKLSSA